MTYSAARLHSSIRSTTIEGGRSGRCLSTSASSRPVRNRDRHLPTVVRSTRSKTATSTLDNAQARTIRHRWVSACDDFARREFGEQAPDLR